MTAPDVTGTHVFVEYVLVRLCVDSAFGKLQLARPLSGETDI